ncbi:MAG: glycosyltransferase family 9 protein [Candidatus Rokubacteria bacterium]|nr:glycosyltransferase family 9 protein [Candidatus Rokubacteria bacterium]
MLTTVIVRLPNWLGDTVMAVPAIRALRAELPATHLVAVGPWAPLLRGQGLADVIVSYPRSWAGRLRSADAVRGRAVEVAVLLPNSFEAALAARYWRARRRIGFALGGRAWLLTDALPLPAPRRHQIDEYLMLVGVLGAVAGEAVPRLAPPPADGEDRAQARRLLREAGALDGAAPLIGVHLGTAFGPSKLWLPQRVADFCRLVRRDGAAPVLLGAPDDVVIVEEVARREPVASLVGRDSPDLLPAVLAELGALVCGDTGVAHLAAALGTPAIALFGPTDPELTAPRGRAAVLRHPVPCAPCFYRACPIDHPCMRGITPEAVRARVFALMAS